MWRLPIWTLLALHRIHSAGAQGTVWATFSTWNWRRGSGGWKRGAPLRHRVWPKLDHLLYVSMLPRFFDFWGSLWGGAVSPILLAFVDREGEVTGGGGEKLRCSRCVFVGTLWAGVGGSRHSVLAPLNSLSSWSCLT